MTCWVRRATVAVYSIGCFFFQAEDGIRDVAVTGVQTCALPISNFSNHTYGMEADALKDVGHEGFLIDAGTMAAILYDYATHSELRDAVKTEFTRIQGLFGEYQTALAKAYPKPEIAEPK